MILYRKQQQLRIRRAPAPQPPFWCATAIAPYSARRAEPVAIDYLALRATSNDRLDVTVCDNARDELERTRFIDEPVLIDAAEQTEAVFRRGEEALAFCEEQQQGALHLISTRGVLPRRLFANAVLAIATWPLELDRLEALFANDFRWGVAVPVIFPVTTDLDILEDLANRARTYGASFFAAVAVEVEATAKQAIAQSMDLAGDDERYAMLFHADVEPIHLATERHIAALAAERGMADFILPPKWEERSNWNAAVLLTLTAARMFTMELDLDLAGAIARSARTITELEKPVARIAEAASLSIVEGIDETSAEMVREWLSSGSAVFAEYVAEQWRLRRR